MRSSGLQNAVCAQGRRRDATGPYGGCAAPPVSRGGGRSARCGSVPLPRRRELWGSHRRGQLLPGQLTSSCIACVLRVCCVCVGAAQPPYGPVDVGGVNFGSGANAFWPGTGSYSTFGLYANSNAEVLSDPCCVRVVREGEEDLKPEP